MFPVKTSARRVVILSPLSHEHVFLPKWLGHLGTSKNRFLRAEDLECSPFVKKMFSSATYLRESLFCINRLPPGTDWGWLNLTSNATNIRIDQLGLWDALIAAEALCDSRHVSGIFDVDSLLPLSQRRGGGAVMKATL